ncbi:hypothetical protein OENI_50032 [Oenococcus oeni]|nr:hypothetical protein OENI_50032 [Oenococcus oeni]
MIKKHFFMISMFINDKNSFFFETICDYYDAIFVSGYKKKIYYNYFFQGDLIIWILKNKRKFYLERHIMMNILQYPILMRI